MRAVIFAGGRICDYTYIKSLLKTDDYIIAADSGFAHVKKMELFPDVMIGDMDSVKDEYNAKEVIKLEVMKDETDTEAAVRVALEKGADSILILGAIGSRADHTMANILLLKMLYDMKVDALLLNENNEIRFFDKEISVCGVKGDTISIIPMSDLIGVYTKGLFYKLTGDILKFGTSRGVSNVMTDITCNVKAESGYGLIIKSRDI